MRNIRTLLRRPRRPIAVLVGAVIGLGALGGATGAVLGELGSAGPAVHSDGGRHHFDRGGPAHDLDGDEDGPGRVG